MGKSDSMRRRCYRWHRRLGLCACIVIMVVAVTGVLLNHNASLGLHRVHIHHPWLLKLYDINDVQEEDFGYPEVLTLDQVILDIHTGRFFGYLGRGLMDLTAIVMLLLAFSGVFLWRSAKTRKRANKNG